jgi:hypothetical protein
MDDLVTWLRAQVEVDQQWVDHAEMMRVPGRHRPEQPDVFAGIGHSPAMVPWRYAAEVEAKRRILGLHEPSQWGSDPAMTCGTCSEGLGLVPWPCATVLALAQVYAGRPGFKDEWRLT